MVALEPVAGTANGQPMSFWAPIQVSLLQVSSKLQIVQILPQRTLEPLVYTRLLDAHGVSFSFCLVFLKRLVPTDCRKTGILKGVAIL